MMGATSYTFRETQMSDTESAATSTRPEATSKDPSRPEPDSEPDTGAEALDSLIPADEPEPFAKFFMAQSSASDNLLAQGIAGIAGQAVQPPEEYFEMTRPFYDGESFDQAADGDWELDESRDVTAFVFPPKLFRSSTLGLIALAIVWIGGGAFFGLQLLGNGGADISDGFLTFMFFFHGLFSVLMLYKILTRVFGREEYRITDDQLIHRRELFGWTRENSWLLDDIEALQIVWKMKSSSKKKKKKRMRRKPRKWDKRLQYNLAFVTNGGKKPHMVEEMNRKEVVWFGCKLRDALLERRQRT